MEPFNEVARQAVYDVISLRRDVRHFEPGTPLGDEVIDRILAAAHLAPSVGFSQPWGFVVVRDRAIRGLVRDSFLKCRAAEAVRFPPERREKYLSYKLEGILDAPVNVCVAADLRSREGAILGTTVQPEAVRASVCCAVQNLWLAARAEGVGVGWVSIVEPAVLRAALHLPPGVEPIAYLCMGYPVEFRDRPLLEEVGWGPRRPLSEVIHRAGRWAEPVVLPPPPVTSLAVPGSVPGYAEAVRTAAIEHQATLTKPAGSLGRLEELAAWYAGARGKFPSVCQRAALTVFAADHGVVVEGVSAYGSQLTAAMVATVMAGGAALSALASRHDIVLRLVDVGIAGDLTAVPRQPLVPLLRRSIRAGTADLSAGAAMTRAEAAQAIAVGRELAADAVEDGADLLGVGEIGIGNTTAAAAMACAFLQAPASELVGRGTGLDDLGVAAKISVVERALRLHAPDPRDPVGVLASVGGLELGAMAGYLLEAAARRRPVVLDGFLASVAALLAQRLDPAVTAYLLASHQSAERGARRVAAHLQLVPLLDLGLRLGEGTGAILGMELVRDAVHLQLSMATFATAGVVGRAGIFPSSPRSL